MTYLYNLWHDFIFWWAIVMTLIVCWQNKSVIQTLAEWIVNQFRGLKS